MRGLLDNIRSRARSPSASRIQRMASAQTDAELEAAMAASLIDSHPFYPSGPLSGNWHHQHGDDEAAIAAAIGASLDLQEADYKGARRGTSSSHGQEPLPGPLRPRDAHEAQDLALLTNAPLIPPSAPPEDGHRALGSGSSNTQDGAAASSQIRRRGRGNPPATAPGVRPRPMTDEDEALARRLQEQWISEDMAAGSLGGGSAGGAGSRDTANNAQYNLSLFAILYSGQVCHERLPREAGGIHFYRHNYFRDVYCPWHHDSCLRLEPIPGPLKGEGAFAELQDGRMVCMSCAQTAVVDSSEAAPAFREICAFFEKELDLCVPKDMREVPVLVVDSPTLNEQTHRDKSHGGGVERGMPTTRGLTLSEVATVMHMGRGTMQFNPLLGRFEVGPPSQVNLGERRAVTAMLVLCGLPYASFSSILAHEAMHALMKLDPSYPTHLPSQVEEGVCQLIALLWLEHLAGGDGADDRMRRRRRPGAPPTEEELRGFFMHQIKTDLSVVYGDGFRKAKAVYDAIGLHALLAHIKRYKCFPSV